MNKAWLVALMTVLPAAASADGWLSPRTLDTLRSAAEALSRTHPELAARLSDIADRQEREQKRGVVTQEGAEVDARDARAAREAAAALERTHEGLARRLKKFADAEERALRGR